MSSKQAIIIYTDGACSGNPGPSGLGVFLQAGKFKREISEYLGEGTNNIAELSAVLKALNSIKDPERTIHLYTDSTYVIGVLTKNWKVKANKELVLQIRQKMKEFNNLILHKVKGHVGVEGNEKADKLATTAVSTQSSFDNYS
jgi:ribonuclease HI